MAEFWTRFSSAPLWFPYLLKIFVLAVTASFLRSLGMRWLRGRSEKTTLQLQLLLILDKALVRSLLLAVAAGSLNLFPLSAKLLKIANRSLYIAFLIVILYYCSQATQLLLNQWLARSEGDESVRQSTRFLVRTLFAIVGIMLLLDNMGISLNAVWTTVGVGGVAVALALQDTLSNFFGGVYLQLDRPVRIGDYFKLSTGEEGFVVLIGWRSTRVRTLANNIIVIPNSKLATATITNYSLPEPQMGLGIQVGVSYDSDPDQIERILVEEATRAAEEVRGLKKDPPPSVAFLPGFGDYSLKFTLNCRVSSYADQYGVQHELQKRILRRFRREGIVMPFPQREIHMHRDGASGSAASDPARAGSSS